MERSLYIKVMSFSLFFGLFILQIHAQNNNDQTLFHSSLHYTAKGMAYWYDQSNGGLESITGIPYTQLGCQNCHVANCDRCHLTERDGIPVYSTKAALKQDMCLKCHAREASILKIDRQANELDVHFANNMICMDCHSGREVHGDGVQYSSMKETKAMDTKCENCHAQLNETTSHTVHEGKVDCKACHERQVVSCTNCHFETLIKEGKRVAIPVPGWVFLMNYDGKVTSANMQTFVVAGNKTFLMFAPQHSHSIMAKGRKCDDCHATKILQQLKKGKLKLTWLQNDKLENLKGVIPVFENVDWEMVYQDRKNGEWVPINNPLAPKLHYAGYGEPLTSDQMQKLLQLQKNEK